MDMSESKVIRQHLIDPEICIRCNTCESVCPTGAMTHDDRNYVVRADVCNQCMACISPCPTGSIDNWRTMLLSKAYSIEEQLTWDVLPAEVPLPEGAELSPKRSGPRRGASRRSQLEAGEAPFVASAYGATLPPWSAAHAYINLYGPKSPTTATVVGNFQRHPGRLRQRHAPRRARLRRDAVPGARRPVDRHRAAGRRRRRPAALGAPVLDRQPAQRRARRLQQRLADGEARARRSPGPARRRRRRRTTSATSRSATRCRSSARSARRS